MKASIYDDYSGEHPPEHDLEELRIGMQADYEEMRRQRHELLDELDMRIATLLEFVDPVQRPLAEHEYRKCSELVGTIALTWPEGT
jgi:hypothetical protein